MDIEHQNAKKREPGISPNSRFNDRLSKRYSAS